MVFPLGRRPKGRRKTIFGFFNQRFLIELFYNRYITNLVLKLGGQTVKVLDRGSIELLGPYGLEKKLINSSKNISSLSKGIVTNYALFILVGFVLYMFSISLGFTNNLSLIILVLTFIISSVSLKK